MAVKSIRMQTRKELKFEISLCLYWFFKYLTLHRTRACQRNTDIRSPSYNITAHTCDLLNISRVRLDAQYSYGHEFRVPGIHLSPRSDTGYLQPDLKDLLTSRLHGSLTSPSALMRCVAMEHEVSPPVPVRHVLYREADSYSAVKDIPWHV